MQTDQRLTAPPTFQSKKLRAEAVLGEKIKKVVFPILRAEFDKYRYDRTADDGRVYFPVGALDGLGRDRYDFGPLKRRLGELDSPFRRLENVARAFPAKLCGATPGEWAFERAKRTFEKILPDHQTAMRSRRLRGRVRPETITRTGIYSNIVKKLLPLYREALLEYLRALSQSEAGKQARRQSAKDATHHREFSPSADYCEIQCQNRRYRLTPLAGKIVRLLHEAHKAGKAGVNATQIRRTTQCRRIWDAFRRRDGRTFWTAFISKEGKYVFKLNLDSAEQRPAQS